MMMAPFIADTENFISQHVVSHMDKILSGEEAVFLSPQYTTKPNGNAGPLLYQLFFDIDSKYVGAAKAQETAIKIVAKLQRSGIEFFFENSQSGIHIWSRHCYELDFSYEKLKQKYGKQFTVSYPGFDFVSSLRNVAVPRLGSYHKHTLIDIHPTIDAAFSNRSSSMPIDVRSEIDWKQLWQEYLFPKRAPRYISQIYRDLFVRGMNR